MRNFVFAIALFLVWTGPTCQSAFSQDIRKSKPLLTDEQRNRILKEVEKALTRERFEESVRVIFNVPSRENHNDLKERVKTLEDKVIRLEATVELLKGK